MYTREELRDLITIVEAEAHEWLESIHESVNGLQDRLLDCADCATSGVAARTLLSESSLQCQLDVRHVIGRQLAVSGSMIWNSSSSVV